MILLTPFFEVSIIDNKVIILRNVPHQPIMFFQEAQQFFWWSIIGKSMGHFLLNIEEFFEHFLHDIN